MKLRNYCFTKYITFGLLSLLIGYSDNLFASGFYLPLSSTSDLGVAFAGSAAIAQDASTLYNNPAGLVLLPQQLVISGIGVANHVEFNGTTSSPGLGSYISQSGSATTKVMGIIPALYYALPINDKLGLGIGIATPYGLGDDYSNDSILRYDVTYIRAASADLSPVIAYKLTDKLSIGAGLDALYFNSIQEAMIRTQPLTTTDSAIHNELAGWGYGWHGGILYQFTSKTRLGLNYRSQIVDHLTGTSKFYLNNSVSPMIPSGVRESNDLATTLHLPPLTTLSFYHKFLSPWAIMASIEYIKWNVVSIDRVFNIATPSGNTTATLVKNYHNTFHYSLGTSYQLNQRWLLRSGLDYDRSPITDTYRDAILPDADRYGAAVGFHYQATKTLGFDAAYYHAFYDNVSVANDNATNGNSTNGTIRSSVNMLGLQLDWNLG